jgi:hypothetical protein
MKSSVAGGNKFKLPHGSTEAIEEENENNYGTMPQQVPMD